VDNSSPGTISCRELHVFEEDASGFATAEPEYAAGFSPNNKVRAEPAIVRILSPVAPSGEAIAAARKCWLKVIQRFTEPVPGKKKHRRVIGGSIGIQHVAVRLAYPLGRAAGQNGTCLGASNIFGDELDCGDKSYLVICRTETDAGSSRMVASAVAWVEIAQVIFPLSQRIGSEAQADEKG
jgi:hypothetical protein